MHPPAPPSQSLTHLTFDLRALTYIAQVDENLCCPICRSPLLDPATTKCRHTFCADCIAGALDNSPTCPVDRNPLSDGDVAPAPTIVSNLVNDLFVLCPNAALGCPATPARALVFGHLKDDCGFVTVACPACAEPIPRRDLAADACMHAPANCPHCDAPTRQLELEVSPLPPTPVS